MNLSVLHAQGTEILSGLEAERRQGISFKALVLSVLFFDASGARP